MRSSAGVGMTPPKVVGAEKPTSSVMISSTLGTPFGGTISAGQYGFDCTALGLISPLKGCGGFGRYLPSMVVVAPGEPGRPVGCWAWALKGVSGIRKRAASSQHGVTWGSSLETLFMAFSRK
jgi:hypothetical protein